MAASGSVAASVFSSQRYHCQKGKTGEGGGEEDGTLKASLLGDVERRVRPRDGILGIAAAGREHLVEGGDAVAGLEFEDARADLLDYAGDVVTLVNGARAQVRKLPVLWVGSGHDHLDQDLILVGLGDRRVDNLHLGACGCGQRTSASPQTLAVAQQPCRTFAYQRLLHLVRVFPVPSSGV